jgi:hypothetical protein|tara:strand:- start:564 stop:743 length:180 start_codon:yes stop_codon:yes gene_type:complete
MSKIKNWMMEIEDFCNGYFYGGDVDFAIDEVVEDVGMYFRSTEAKEYAKGYLEKTLGEM